MNRSFYNSQESRYLYQIDDRGYIPPNNSLGEIESQLYWDRYRHLSNQTNHLLKIRCKGVYAGGLFTEM